MSDIAALDLVECIDDHPSLAETTVMPEMGRLYTVDCVRTVGDGRSVRLIELDPTCYRGGPCACGECGWDARRFRKIYRPRLAVGALTAVRKTRTPARSDR